MRNSEADAVIGDQKREASCYEAHQKDAPAIRDVLARIGDKWSLLIIVTLKEGKLRFSELHERIPGVSQRMLTRTLRHLERDGLVDRRVHAQVPPRVDYTLTERGRTLIDPALALATWSIAHFEGIQAARTAYDSPTVGGD
ncbi:helix-turn-helix domain-containing protein [Microbacterium sp. W4I20]|uniref:winged helix-turn-helix transcriptional regulator n=1 Tax=Microbacterium sp. W4I20 TaxID=3042262 RepID=UPI00277F509F|nr:helix-turn-helix domain-containing protein [Microbacterium sp. W4I20]MDQ0729159.1 DNA-binding HxlR family transcriptional regulator [Microbacterium sp. W4I20]